MGEALPDVLGAGMRVVFCGTAAGARSARVGAYYAGPGNKFWRVLHETGLVPAVLGPEDFAQLTSYGVGLTDLAKRASGADRDLSAGDFDVAGLTAKVRRYRPGVLCFNGKAAAKAFLGVTSVGYGPAASPFEHTRLFVAPSTSGAANGYWDATHWHNLARLCGADG